MNKQVNFDEAFELLSETKVVQTQEDLNSQLIKLKQLANKFGLYDASDYIDTRIIIRDNVVRCKGGQEIVVPDGFKEKIEEINGTEISVCKHQVDIVGNTEFHFSSCGTHFASVTLLGNYIYCPQCGKKVLITKEKNDE